MFRPNVICTVTRMNGERSLYGQTRPGETYRTKCGIVRMEEGQLKTSVRADSSASRGMAKERTAIARLLFLPSVEIESRDKVVIGIYELEVESVFPRYDVNGKLDHLQVDLLKWASE